MSSNFYIFFNSFTLINLCVLFIILFFRKSNSFANKILAFIIINPGLNFISNILIQSGHIHSLPYSLFIFFGTAQLYAPLILAYTLVMMGQKYKFVSVLSLLTLIVIMLDTYFAFLFSRLDKPQQTEYLNNLTSPQNYPPDMQLINTLFVIVMTVYFIVALFRIIKHKRLAQDFYSNIEVIKIRYTRNFIILVTALNTMLAVVYTLFPAPIVEYFYIPLISNIIYIFIVYYAFSQSAVLDKTEYCTIIKEASDLERFKEMKEPLCKEIEELKKQENTKDKKWKLTEIEIDYNYKKILDYMKNKKPYLDSNLNLTKFSSALSACSHNISLTLNVRFKQNFFDFINSYRVEEAKQMLKNNNINFITVEAIGFDAGFNSKTAFYRAFKKHTGQTPMEYVSSQNLNKDYA